jgi:predicted RNA-binding Zn ribbon-like protein
MTDGTQVKPAPGELALVQAFVNTLDAEEGPQGDGVEKLATPEGLRGWLLSRSLIEPGETVTAGDLRRAIEVREGLRAMLFAHNDRGELDEAAVETLDRAAARAGLRVRFTGRGGVGLEPDARGVDGAIARILAAIPPAVANGTWKRLKACRRETCRWAFYDATKNHSGKWCTMETCGDREKARAYRERRRQAGR